MTGGVGVALAGGGGGVTPAAMGVSRVNGWGGLDARAPFMVCAQIVAGKLPP